MASAIFARYENHGGSCDGGHYHGIVSRTRKEVPCPDAGFVGVLFDHLPNFFVHLHLVGMDLLFLRIGQTLRVPYALVHGFPEHLQYPIHIGNLPASAVQFNPSIFRHDVKRTRRYVNFAAGEHGVLTDFFCLRRCRRYCSCHGQECVRPHVHRGISGMIRTSVYMYLKASESDDGVHDAHLYIFFLQNRSLLDMKFQECSDLFRLSLCRFNRIRIQSVFLHRFCQGYAILIPMFQFIRI